MVITGLGYEILVAIVLLLLSLSLRWLLKQKNKSVILNWPLLGSSPVLLRNILNLHDWFTHVFISLGTYSFYLKGPIFSKLDQFVTCDPQNFEHILKTNPSNYPKGEDFTEAFDILGDGIFNAEGDSWHAQRKTAHWVFRSIDFRSFVSSTVQKKVEQKLLPMLARVAREGTTVDFQDVCMRFTFDSINITIAGRDLGCLSEELPINEVAQAVDDAQAAILFRLFTPTFLWKLLRLLRLGPEKKLARAWQLADASILDIILHKKEQLLKGIDTEENSLLSNFIRSLGEKNDWSEPRVKFLRDTVLNFFMAGRNTTASGIIWFIWLVSRNPRVEEKILQELRLVVSDKLKEGGVEYKKPWVFDSEDLRELVYLHAALCESLRLCPPNPVNVKGVVKEEVLPDGRIVKPGMQVILSMYAVGRMPSLWGDDCLEFRPERWIRPDGTLDKDKISKLLFAFSIGQRSCLGKNMALTNMKLAASAVLFNFQIQVVEDHPISYKPAIMLEVKDGLMIKVKERASWF